MKLNGMMILVLVLALAAVSGVAWTQAGDDKPVCPLTGEPTSCTGDGPHGPHGLAGPNHHPGRMAAALDLTDEQRDAVREIMVAEREAIHQRMEAVLSGILTPEQAERLDAVKDRQAERKTGRLGRMGRRGNRGPRGGGDGDMGALRLERMTEHLDLTPDQQDRIRLILEEAVSPPRSEIRGKIMEVLTLEQQAKMGQWRSENSPGRQGRMGRGKGRWNSTGHPGFPQRLAAELKLTDEQQEQVREQMDEIRAEQQSNARARIEALLTPEQREKLEQIHPN